MVLVPELKLKQESGGVAARAVLLVNGMRVVMVNSRDSIR